MNPFKKFAKGYEFKNYPDLCNQINTTPKQGGAKATHLRELSKYGQLTKAGHKFILTEIYEEPILTNQTFPFANETYFSLLKKFSEHDGRYNMFISTLNKEVGLYNENFHFFYTKRMFVEMAELLEIDSKILESVMNTINYYSKPDNKNLSEEEKTPLSGLVTSIVNELIKKEIISGFSYGYRAKVAEQKIISKKQGPLLYEKYGKIKYELEHKAEQYVECSDEEIKKINMIHYQLMQFYNMDIDMLIKNGKYSEYVERCRSEVYDTLGYEYYGKSITFIYNNEIIDEVLRGFVTEENKKKFNDFMIEKVFNVKTKNKNLTDKQLNDIAIATVENIDENRSDRLVREFKNKKQT